MERSVIWQSCSTILACLHHQDLTRVISSKYLSLFSSTERSWLRSKTVSPTSVKILISAKDAYQWFGSFFQSEGEHTRAWAVQEALRVHWWQLLNTGGWGANKETDISYLNTRNDCLACEDHGSLGCSDHDESSESWTEGAGLKSGSQLWTSEEQPLVSSVICLEEPHWESVLERSKITH